MSNLNILNIKQKNRNTSWLILAALVILLFSLAIFFTLKISDLQKATEDLNYIEYLSSTTQRLLKLTLDDRETDKLIFYLDDIIRTSFDYKHSTDFFSVDNENLQKHAKNVIGDWQNIKNIVSEESINFDDLYFAGERHFFHATNLSLEANKYIQVLSWTVIGIEIALLTNILCIGAIIASNLIQTHVELKLSKEFARTSFLDGATGLFNRSKCQELFKADISPCDNEASAIIVFDLNDLKITNDKYGHRIGDELISSFATLLQNAAKVHITEPFIGRYGGDEFIVFYSNSNEEEVKLFLEELKYLSAEFNSSATKFAISYAAGYALTLNKESHISIRQLFDKADEAMYANKKIIKQARKEQEEQKNNKLEAVEKTE